MKFSRLTTTFIFSAVLVSGSLLFVVSQKVQSTERDINFLETKISREKSLFVFLRPSGLILIALTG